MKKKLFLPLVLICYVLIAVCALAACNDATGYSAFYGTYQSLWDVGGFTISEDGVTTSDGVTSPVSYDGNKLTLEFANIPWELTPYENNDVLVLGDAVSFDTVEIGTRNGYFSGRLLNYSGMSVGEQYTFNADGSYSYIDVSSGGTLQHSGRYALVNGVLFMRGATWLGGSVQCGFYITESYEFYINVYVRQLDSYAPEPGDPVIEYETTDAARGEVQGDTSQQLGEGETGTPVTAVARDGYTFTEWSDGRTDNPRTDSGLESNTTVYASFEPVYDIVFVTTEGGRIASGETSQRIVGDGVTSPVTAEAEPGYRFLGWSRMEDQTALTAEISTSVFNLQWHTGETYTITASFEKIVYTAKYTCQLGGLLNGESSSLTYEVDYEDGYTTPTVTAAPRPQPEYYDGFYVFVGWSDGVKEATRRDVLTEDLSVTALFDHYVTISFTVEGGGALEGELEQYITGDASTAPVTAIPDDGWVFAGWWTKDGDFVTDEPTITHRRGDNSMYYDAEYIAVFELLGDTWELIYKAGPGGSIIGETSQTVPDGESGTAVTAVPEEGYEFVRWSDGVTTAARADTDVARDISVTAEFEIAPDYTPFAGGDGNVDNPYEIATAAHLRNMELYPDACYVLTADITLPEVGAGESNFTPLFSDAEMFEGSLDGQGHKIVGLTVHNTSTFYAGLFSCIGASGSVTDLVLENASVSGTNYMGCIAGYALGPVTGCTVTGSIVYLDGSDGYKVFAGGIAGRAEASVDGCVTEVSIIIEGAKGETYAGGIAGYLTYGGSDTPLTLAASGDITVSASADVSAYAGGLAGYVSDDLTITHSYATGNVTSSVSGSRAGGLVGEASYDLTITDSYATGDVTSSGHLSYAGGLVGYCSGFTITDSHATGNVTSSGSSNSICAGGLVGYGLFHLTITDSYATGNVTSSGSSSTYAGGLVGCGSNGFTVTHSYATGNVTSLVTEPYVTTSYAGGLIGRGSDLIIADSYTTGSVTSSSDSHAGGLVGYGSGDLTVRNSYSVSCVSAEAYVGGLAGYISGRLTIENAHWFSGEGTAAEYAVGYSEDLGIPTSIGSTAHESLAEFYSLADALNAGREDAVREHKGEDTLPTLIEKTKKMRRKVNEHQ